MSALDTEFHRRLIKKLNEAEQNKTNHLRTGNLDYDQYKKECGYLGALEHVRSWCAEIETNINEGN